jgi:hypothetical protein
LKTVRGQTAVSSKQRETGLQHNELRSSIRLFLHLPLIIRKKAFGMWRIWRGYPGIVIAIHQVVSSEQQEEGRMHDAESY